MGNASKMGWVASVVGSQLTASWWAPTPYCWQGEQNRAENKLSQGVQPMGSNKCPSCQRMQLQEFQLLAATCVPPNQPVEVHSPKSSVCWAYPNSTHQHVCLGCQLKPTCPSMRVPQMQTTKHTPTGPLPWAAQCHCYWAAAFCHGLQCPMYPDIYTSEHTSVWKAPGTWSIKRPDC